MSTQPVLTGDLNFIDLADLLQLLNADGKSGVVKLSSRYVETPGVIHVLDGNPINAFCNGKEGEDALYTLFGWGEGGFEFSLDEFPHDRVIQKTAMAIILDALKLVDEGEIEKVGPVQYTGDKMRDESGRIHLPVVRGPAFSDYMYLADEEAFRAGDRIIEQGRHGNWIWVVLEGVVKIVKSTPKGDVVVSRVGSGAFVGNLSSLTRPDHPRSASAIAEGEVLLGVIDTRHLTSDLAGLSDAFLQLVRGLEHRLAMISDRAVALKYSGAPVSDLPREVKPVIRQGDHVTKLFSVEAGQAHLVQDTGGKRVFLGTMGPGDFIGRLPMFKHVHEPEMASVFASPDLKLSILDTDVLMAEYDKAPNLIKNMIEYTSVCVSLITDLASRNIL
ncbi:cyclic nucleotide-binding domain-containing protein [Desulfoluna spongiiphila]|uniref:Cyclic nucleotide-binding domain-containing protein n=1 Tax=Desulfoluna spongiiphila TaxID=419481 RepID=A0A1G5FPG2_9BACT|nr:cyclic nucleotide-binding domain-containing protein [Desulfoluna spongiiphila]SCY41027.1 Cyclic nucleotide-binding domain-containing protein [Desulfoluna spongiiphila]VVS95487.1 rmlc-like jelly roll fold [Desulfoluna spongiiphila]